MRILQVTIYGELKFGGPPQKIFALSDGLSARGHSVQIATFHSEIPGGKAPGAQGESTIHFLPWRGRELLQLPLKWRRLRALVREADIVHLYGLYNLLCPLAALMAKRAGKPYLLEPLGMYVPRARNLRFKVVYNRFVTLPLARGAARVVATSPRELEELKTLVSPDKLVMRRNGLDLSGFENMPPGAAFRERFDLAATERIVLFIGRISPIKNLENLVRGFQIANVADTRLILVGPSLEPEYAARLNALIGELSLENRVLLTGELFGNDKLSVLSAAEIFVLPSTYESYGNAAAEAVAAGLPVLLTPGCGIAPLIDQKAGLAVEPDAGSLAAGLKRLLEDDAERERLTARREEVRRELSWDAPLQLTEEVYEEINRALAEK